MKNIISPAPLLALAALALAPAAAQTPPAVIRPLAQTEPVASDPDDPAVWINKTNRAQSRILGTNKAAAKEGGALYVFDLQGKTRQIIKDLDRPNNVDVEYGLRLGGRSVDIAVVTERLQSRLRVYEIARNGSLKEIARVPVFGGEKGEQAAPMGVALYKRPKDGALFAVVGRKEGPKSGYLWQYRLRDDGAGKIAATLVRKFGAYSGKKEIEALFADDAAGYVYYADETFGIRKYAADPDAQNAGKELALFGTKGWTGDHEGIALYAEKNGGGYLVCTDQIKGNTRYHIFPRSGGKTHKHKELAVIAGGADETDGIEITSEPLGEAFPHGVFAAMNSGPKNFLLFDAREVKKAARKR